jgi:hypothetical protein
MSLNCILKKIEAELFMASMSWKAVHSALVRINEDLLEREVAAPV